MIIYKQGDFIKDRIWKMVEFLSDEFGVTIPNSTFVMPEVVLSSEEVMGKTPTRDFKRIVNELMEHMETLEMFKNMLRKLRFEGEDEDSKSMNEILDRYRNLIDELLEIIGEFFELRDCGEDRLEKKINCLNKLIGIIKDISARMDDIKNIINKHRQNGDRVPEEIDSILDKMTVLIKTILRLYKKIVRTFAVLGIYQLAENKIKLYVPAIGRYCEDFNAGLEATLAHELFHALHCAILASKGERMTDYLLDDKGNTVCESLAIFFEYAWCVIGAAKYAKGLHTEDTLNNLRKYGAASKDEAIEDFMDYPDWPYAAAYGLMQEYDRYIKNSEVDKIRKMLHSILFTPMLVAYDNLDELNVKYLNMETPVAKPTIIERHCNLGDTLVLERKYDNWNDKNAIVVHFTDGKTGYLPASVAQDLAPFMDKGFKICCKVVKSSYYSGFGDKLALKTEILV